MLIRISRGEPSVPSFPILCGSIASHPSRVGQAIHNAMFKQLELDYTYVAFGIEDVGAAIAAMRTLGIRGFGVTMPHKVTIMKFLDVIDPVAYEIGAVNTVVNDNGVLTGYNLDWLGAMLALEEHVNLARKRAFVIGAGGAARAVAFGLKRRGATVVIFNRTPEHGQKLATDLGVEFGGDLAVLSGDYDILVHTTSAGYVSQPGVCIVPESILSKDKIVMDVVAEPLETPLLQLAKSKACTCIPGYRMRLHQAAAQFEMYTGQIPPLYLMESALLEAMGLKLEV
jgi:shikimate dehydrogenase